MVRDTVPHAQMLLAASLPANYAPFFYSFPLAVSGHGSFSLIHLFLVALGFQPWAPTRHSASFNATHFTESSEKTQVNNNTCILKCRNKYDFLKSLKTQSILQHFAKLFNTHPAPGLLPCGRGQTIISSQHSSLQ